MGLCLRGLFRKICIPSSYTLEQQHPWGSHVETDKYWSTESLGFVHDGAEASRVEKVVSQVARSKTALKYLRVCYKNVAQMYNCGECEKCIRTMINLLVAGNLKNCQTFPQYVDAQKVSSIKFWGDNSRLFQEENLEALRIRKIAPEIQSALVTSLRHTNIMTMPASYSILKKLYYIDHVYLRGILLGLHKRLTSLRRFL